MGRTHWEADCLQARAFTGHIQCSLTADMNNDGCLGRGPLAPQEDKCGDMIIASRLWWCVAAWTETCVTFNTVHWWNTVNISIVLLESHLLEMWFILQNICSTKRQGRLYLSFRYYFYFLSHEILLPHQAAYCYCNHNQEERAHWSSVSCPALASCNFLFQSP